MGGGGYYQARDCLVCFIVGDVAWLLSLGCIPALSARKQNPNRLPVRLSVVAALVNEVTLFRFHVISRGEVLL